MPHYIMVVTASDDLTDGFSFDFIGPIEDQDTVDTLIADITSRDWGSFRVDAREIEMQTPQQSEWTTRSVIAV